jgi:flagellar biosynthesis/type III secretory pathway protein FliH
LKGEYEGRARGIAQGYAEGYARGYAEGSAKIQKEIALAMKKHDIDLLFIADVTKLSIEEIQKL